MSNVSDNTENFFLDDLLLGSGKRTRLQRYCAYSILGIILGIVIGFAYGVIIERTETDQNDRTLDHVQFVDSDPFSTTTDTIPIIKEEKEKPKSIFSTTLLYSMLGGSISGIIFGCAKWICNIFAEQIVGETIRDFRHREKE